MLVDFVNKEFHVIITTISQDKLVMTVIVNLFYTNYNSDFRDHSNGYYNELNSKHYGMQWQTK